MHLVSPSFVGKLSPRRPPERGSLKRCSETTSPPKNSTPILSLPPEVRACIFKHLMDDVDIIFKFDKDFTTSSSWAKWPDFNRNLCFMKACKIFEAEALALVQVQAISIEVDPPPDPHLSSPNNPAPTYSKFSASVPQSLGIRLETVRPHLRTLTIDARYTLNYLLETDLLETFPKLQILRVRQTLWPRDHEYNYREALNQKSRQQLLIKESLGETIASSQRFGGIYPPRLFRCKYDNIKLRDLLAHPKLAKFQPIFVDVKLRAIDCTQHRWASEDGPTYPITRDVSNVRFSYQWPSKQLLDMEVDMYNQPMALAIKSEWTETVLVRNDIEDKGSGEGEVMDVT